MRRHTYRVSHNRSCTYIQPLRHRNKLTLTRYKSVMKMKIQDFESCTIQVECRSILHNYIRTLHTCMHTNLINDSLILWFIKQMVWKVRHLEYRVAQKKRNGILPTIFGCNNCMVSVYEVSSPEKNDTKISNFGSVVCFLGHILCDNVEAQIVFFSA